MSEAPERIWIADDRHIGGDRHIWDDPSPDAQKYATKYLRADIADQRIREAEEAAYRRAATEVETLILQSSQFEGGQASYERGFVAGAASALRLILALTPEEPK